ncbi:hypothetical protein M9Y10_021144 [Tritrichomonas musculus]|uniref:Uncharacterized protein n=1 Tax=Tritrichomonas musculus TaxID=1915356 RepID=A0ABR2HDZ5_9EUKA
MTRFHQETLSKSTMGAAMKEGAIHTCRYPPGFSFSSTYEFTFSSTFSASNKNTETVDSESLSSIQNPPQITSTITITKSSQKKRTCNHNFNRSVIANCYKRSNAECCKSHVLKELLCIAHQHEICFVFIVQCSLKYLPSHLRSKQRNLHDGHHAIALSVLPSVDHLLPVSSLH